MGSARLRLAARAGRLPPWADGLRSASPRCARPSGACLESASWPRSAAVRERHAQQAVAGERADEELVADAQADGAGAHRGAAAVVDDLGRERLRIEGDDLELERTGAALDA